MLKVGGAEPGNRLSFVAADLEKDAGWPEAAKGCEYVLHVASPFPQTVPKDENELIVPAREGALRVLRAARDAGVQARGDDVVVCRDRLWAEAADDAVHGDELDQSQGQRRAALCQVEDAGGA